MADAHYPLLPDSARFNKLGGAYLNGKPLPKWLRREIIALAQNGVRQCDISRRLRITHGCVSKILSKYQKTGNFEPGIERAARLRIITTPKGFRAGEGIKEQRRLFSSEIPRDGLREENQCGVENFHVFSSMIRSFLQTGSVEQKEPRTSQEQVAGRSSHVIASMLNLSFNKQPTTTNNEIQPLQQSESFPHTAVLCRSLEGAYCPLPIRRRERTKYTSEQLGLLEAAFKRNKYLTPSIEKQLARDIGVETTKIQVWFSNRRAKERKKASVAFCADSNTQSPQGGMGNRYRDFLVARPPPPFPPPPRGIGTSRIYFPSRAHVSECSESFQTTFP